MASEEQLGILRQGAGVWNAWRKERDAALFEVDFSNADLRETDLRGADLHSADLREAILLGVDLQGAALYGADLHGALLLRVDLHGADLHRANLFMADLRAVNLCEAILDGAALRKAAFFETDLSGAKLYKTDLRDTDFRDTDLRGANLDGADFRGANFLRVDFSGANLSRAALGGADLRDAVLLGAKFNEADLRETDLRGADLCGADLTGADLQQAAIIDCRFDGTTLTGARLWETQRSGWSIKNVICERVFWDRDAKEPNDYGEGEFERIFAEKPRIVLRYPGGVSPIDLLMLPLIIERLQAEHLTSKLTIRSMQDDAGGALVTITVEDLANRGDEVFRLEVVRLQTKLQCIEAERDRLADCFMPQLLDVLAMSRQTNIIGQITGQATIGGAVSRDTYNVHGQAGAVGPGAHAHHNTFQQIQEGAMDLPKLAEQLGQLRLAMKTETIGTREQDKAIGAVADAEEAAAKGDGSSALRYLKSAGSWAAGIAEKIAVPFAVEALKRAM